MKRLRKLTILLTITLITAPMILQAINIERLKKDDKNKDGKITRDEFGGPPALFKKIDKNGDGVITETDYSGEQDKRQPRNRKNEKTPASGDVNVSKDIVYGKGGDRDLLLDIYTPKETPKEPMPVIVYIHGGGWRNGNKNGGSKYLAPALKRGYLGVSISYRLSGEAIFPAQIEDCKCAIRFLRANANKYNLDPSRIGVWGSSAGGHLVALLGTSGDVKKLEGKGGHEKFSSRVNAVCDWFGPTDLFRMDDVKGKFSHLAAGSPESHLVGGGPLSEHRELAESVNPIVYITKDDPPFLIMHGDKDYTVILGQSELLQEALEKAGLQSELYIVKGGGHGFGGSEESGEELRKMALDFFDKCFK